MMAGILRHRLGSLGRCLVAAVLFAFALPAPDAEANTRACRQLEAQLASASSPSGNASAQARRLDTAIDRQREQMTKARGQAQRAGCGRAITGGAVSQCASLNSTIQRMESNLAGLQTKRARLGGGTSRSERARIIASLESNGCRTGASASRQQQAGSRSQDAGGTRVQATLSRGTGALNLSGNFRTMCVRTCDGYYFPISYSVSSAAFARDANACQSVCPGTNVELFVHRVPGQETDAMVSASTGQRYTEMENAFLYRKGNASVPAGCGCGVAAQAARGFQVLAGDHGNGIVSDQPDASAVTAALPQPSERPDPAEDPETLLSREGGLDAETLKRLATPIQRPGEAPDAEGERQIRVVGPVFLPDPEEAIDLRVQDPNRVQ